MNAFLESMVKKKRRQFDELCAGRNIPPAVFEGAVEERDIPYLPDGDKAHRLDLYYPYTLVKPPPVIINIHGGGLIMGSKEFNRHFCLNLCKLGFLVFSVEYRLCPETTVFGQLQDIYRAMNYIDLMLPQLGAQPGRAYMVGDSAGAFLALYASAIQRNPQLAKAAGVRPSYLEIEALGLISGMFYTTAFDSIGLFLPELLYGKGWRKHPFRPYLKPDHPLVSQVLPPTLLITSKADNLRRYTYRLEQARRNYGPYTILDCGDDLNLTHAFPVFDPELPQSRRVLSSISSFFLMPEWRAQNIPTKST